MNHGYGARRRPADICPASYSYSPSSFARAAELRAEVLYVVGGLYGNRFALAEIERMAESEAAAHGNCFQRRFSLVRRRR